MAGLQERPWFDAPFSFWRWKSSLNREAPRCPQAVIGYGDLVNSYADAVPFLAEFCWKRSARSAKFFDSGGD
ncbi:MAG: hypothetical protein C0483_24095 [Pirellula sp.]|nr:hypothetical protein [Pirellula sp.]